MDRIDGLSLDLEKQNIEKIKEIFPTAVEEGKINFDMLRILLGDEVDDSKEKYQFTWNGKSKAIKLAQTPSSATLRPCKEKSKNWDTTENLYIEGDNLEVLKQLQKTYYGRIKIIYIDPPYNTGNDFIYKVDFKNRIKNNMRQTNQNISSNPENSGRFHTDWLNFMYPRLFIANTMLDKDGVIFISIGDNEQDNLKKMCNEIFGEANFISCCPRIAKRTSNKGTFFKPTKDYILVYAKNSSAITWRFGAENKVVEEDFAYEDERGKYKKNGASLYQPSLDSRPNQRYYIECPDGSLIIPPGTVFPDEKKDGAKVKPLSNNDKCWRWSLDTYLNNKDKLMFTEASSSCPLIDSERKPSKWNIYDKVYLEDKIEETLLPEDVIYDYVNSQGTKEIISYGLNFSFAKPVGLIKYLIKLTKMPKESIIMDFFSGSSTTADAVMSLNTEDGGNRKFIMVQFPELISEKDPAYKDDYKNICEIGEERIRRAGEHIKSEWKKAHPSDILFANDEKFTTDIGFKVFKLDSSNVNEWDSSLELEEKELAERLGEVFKKDRSKEDILYEIMLKYGVFDKPVEEVTVNGKTMYRVGKRYMIVCLEDDVTAEDVKAIAELSPKTVIFKEEGFNDDNAKINAIYNLEKAGIEDIKCI